METKDHEVVKVDSTFGVRDDLGWVENWHLVPYGESAPFQGRLSEKTPLARTLLNSAGHRVKVDGPTQSSYVGIERLAAA